MLRHKSLAYVKQRRATVTLMGYARLLVCSHLQCTAINLHSLSIEHLLTDVNEHDADEHNG